jgi:hypothetical protein
MNFTKGSTVRLGFALALALACPLTPSASKVMPVATHDAHFNEPVGAHSARFEVRAAKFWRPTAVATRTPTTSGSVPRNPPLTKD